MHLESINDESFNDRSKALGPFTFLNIYTDPQTGVVTEAIHNRNMRSRYR